MDSKPSTGAKRGRKKKMDSMDAYEENIVINLQAQLAEKERQLKKLNSASSPLSKVSELTSKAQKYNDELMHQLNTLQHAKTTDCEKIMLDHVQNVYKENIEAAVEIFQYYQNLLNQ